MFYVSGLSLLCRDYLLLEIGFWLFYGCFPVKAIWPVFYGFMSRQWFVSRSFYFVVYGGGHRQ